MICYVSCGTLNFTHSLARRQIAQRLLAVGSRMRDAFQMSAAFECVLASHVCVSRSPQQALIQGWPCNAVQLKIKQRL